MTHVHLTDADLIAILDRDPRGVLALESLSECPECRTRLDDLERASEVVGALLAADDDAWEREGAAQDAPTASGPLGEGQGQEEGSTVEEGAPELGWWVRSRGRTLLAAAATVLLLFVLGGPALAFVSEWFQASDTEPPVVSPSPSEATFSYPIPGTALTVDFSDAAPTGLIVRGVESGDVTVALVGAGPADEVTFEDGRLDVSLRGATPVSVTLGVPLNVVDFVVVIDGEPLTPAWEDDGAGSRSWSPLEGR